MSEEQATYKKMAKATKSEEPAKTRRTKKSMVVSDDDHRRLKLIVEKAANLRKEMDISYEEFAIRAGINRNSYYRFEKSADSGDYYTVALLLTVISGLGLTPAEFFKDIQ
jgi:DNA-binding XRE family transcriptional regulator